ncbi:cytochrome b5-like heme binding domain-containing protein [Penicillium sp. IBT 35674x]|uniref:cytochrome b5-like heme binding domain-containing protein n=1 Tax=Penicillium pulvis TaxID=1562058 RepID=UPI00254914E7|nr:cytochrome b5-like heme binding domain-containing protein [Penicillium pulvis]KAJ5802279.1 cytochrome b5-like heme binding domain-containing protein [Penicillium pulvis]KAJ6006533.1 cytochrome b5-like heme binding domain-containing protein [Penicillium sp. IBT 35674x]
MSQSFTPADVAAYNNADKGLYIIVDSNVYDVTKFVDEHPGGAKILKRVAGKDASKQFWKYHNESVLKKYSPKLKVGEVKEAAKL